MDLIMLTEMKRRQKPATRARLTDDEVTVLLGILSIGFGLLAFLVSPPVVYRAIPYVIVEPVILPVLIMEDQSLLTAA